MSSFLRVPSVVLLLVVTFAGCKQEPDPVEVSDYLTELQTADRLKELSPDTTLLGLQLNAPLSLPPCDGNISVNERPSCLMGNRVALADSERPDFMALDKTLLVEVDKSEKLQQVLVTIKPENVAHVRELLTIKYGKPDYTNEGWTEPTWFWNYADMDMALVGHQGLSYIAMGTAALRAKNRAEAQAEMATMMAAEAKKRTL